MEISSDGGESFSVIEGPNDDMTFPGTESTNGGNPASPQVYTGAENGVIDSANLPSTVNTSFTANGTDDVIIQFTPYTVAVVHRALFALNGFELTGPFGFGGEVRITSAEFNENGDYILDFIGNPNTKYELTKSLTLNKDFASIPAETDTDGTGAG